MSPTVCFTSEFTHWRLVNVLKFQAFCRFSQYVYHSAFVRTLSGKTQTLASQHIVKNLHIELHQASEPFSLAIDMLESWRTTAATRWYIETPMFSIILTTMKAQSVFPTCNCAVLVRKLCCLLRTLNQQVLGKGQHFSWISVLSWSEELNATIEC